jgi:hypothetical protein
MNENMTPGHRERREGASVSLSLFHLPIFQQPAIQEAEGMWCYANTGLQTGSNEALIYLRLWNFFLSLITLILDLMISRSLFRCLCKTSNTDNSFFPSEETFATCNKFNSTNWVTRGWVSERNEIASFTKPSKISLSSLKKNACINRGHLCVIDWTNTLLWCWTKKALQNTSVHD